MSIYPDFIDTIGYAMTQTAAWFYVTGPKSTHVMVCMRAVPGWTAGDVVRAVMDDFGNLVKVN